VREIRTLGLTRRELETDLRFGFQGTYCRTDVGKTNALGGRLVLEGHEFVAELFGLPLEFRFEPLLPLRISGRPDRFVLFDLS
jgi:hypothetical protein